MDYMQEDPYSSHRFAPHDPYYSGGSGGGGGYEGNYGNNTSFERMSEHSIHSDRNRMVKNYAEIPNGGPYGSSNNIYRSDQQLRASPLPARSLDPNDYAHHGSGDVEGRDYEREAPHNYLSYDYYDDGDTPSVVNPGYVEENPRSYDHVPSHPSHHFDDEELHAGFGQRDISYQGSHSSFHGTSGVDPHLSGNYNDPYGDPRDHYQEEPPRYNGGVHYPEDSYGGQGPDYIDQRGGYDDDPQGYHDDPQGYHDDPQGYHDDLEPPRPEDYRDIHNRSRNSHDEPYLDSFQPPPSHPHHQNTSFHDLRHDSFQEPYDVHPPPQHHSQYLEHDRYSDASQEHQQNFEPPGNGYDDENDQQRRYDGLPLVRQHPFADDPFQEQNSREAKHILQEDPYYRGQSPAGGPEPVPYDVRGPVRDDHDLSYDERDGPDPYSQNVLGYNDYPPEDPYLSEASTVRRMERLTLGAPPEGHHTPSIDGRGLSHSMRQPDLQEVIDFLSSPDDSTKASAAAHLQHLVYMDDAMKAKTRSIGGIRPLIRLLSHDLVEVHKNACGALQNLSYGKNNNDNKRAIKNENGIPELIRLLRKTDQEDVKESVTGVLWNLSSCDDLKQSIIDDGLAVLVNSVILKCSSRSPINPSPNELPWTTVCRNTTGILRNVSSAGLNARKRLRECEGLVNALINILKMAADNMSTNDIDNKVVENTVCILRNLSYRIQEVVDPDFFKNRTLPRQQNQGKGKSGKDSNAGCFGNKSTKAKAAQGGKTSNQPSSAPPQLPAASVQYRSLWGSEIHTLYSTVLKRCTNPITMEAAAGAIQNLTACDWQPAVESRAMVRKEKGLPLLVDLLSAESDRVVCATATALRNLAIDEKNKELVGKYAIRQLVSRLPRDNRSNMPDDTICAVVATLYEVVKDNQDFALALVQEEGLHRLMHINTSEGRYLARTLKFTQTLLKTLWSYKALHAEYTKLKYVQTDFTMSKAKPRLDNSRSNDMSRTPVSSNHTTPYNTLSRPVSGQGYDDNTLTPARAQQQRGFYNEPGEMESFRQVNRNDSKDSHGYPRETVQMTDLAANDLSPGYAPLDEPRPHRTKAPVGGVPLFPNLTPAEPATLQSEPLYAQVNKGNRRRNDPYDSQMLNTGSTTGIHHNMDGSGGGADSWV
ncbi:splicing regulator ARVCF-like isoform X2 [Physella acuta]|nr:splicing regulator ARVCF-like isoform X2 [Physella acuta]XP_059170842.1 splicing regulator ARVCF-like isoform X2 [Physella acuta]